MRFKYAVVGATGNVGREILQILAEREVMAADVSAVASARSVGAEVSYGEDNVLGILDLNNFDFEGTDIVLSSPGAKVSAEYVPRATSAGAIVIDNTSHFRMDPDIPLVVPEVNPEAIAEFRNRNIIANPNCSTIQLVVATTNCIVEQFGFAIIFLFRNSAIASGFTSGTTRGMSGSIRKCDVLSITIAPAEVARGTYSAETLAPGLDKTISVPSKSKLFKSRIPKTLSSP